MKQTRQLQVILLGALLAACSKDEGAQQSEALALAPPEARPRFVSIPESEVDTKLAGWARGKKALVDSFSITRFPIAVAEYRKCVLAGICAPPDQVEGKCSEARSDTWGSTYQPEPGSSDALPVTCVSSKMASTYCRWVGGRLPTGEEVLSAARGKTQDPYSWGSALPTCEHHWLGTAEPAEESGVDCDPYRTAILGQHPKGASANGLEDLLTAPGGELVGAAKTSEVCRALEAPQLSPTDTAASVSACALRSRPSQPGLLAHSVPVAFEAGSEHKQSPTDYPMSFRCAVEVSQ